MSNKMDDKYLWDRSGKPDPEIQELEEILSTLRYQPRPLEIPAHFQIARRRSLFPPLAIAATLILFAVAIGLWIKSNQGRESIANKPAATSDQGNTAGPAIANPGPAEFNAGNTPKVDGPPRQEAPKPRPLLAVNKSRTRKSQPPKLTPEELALKEQVLIALRLTSAKLNVAQRSIQGPPPANMIRNQHKIG